MQSSQPSAPRILRCPHCGGPLEAPPLALLTRCAYCGHSVKLAEPSAPRPIYPQQQPRTPAASGPSRLVPIMILVGFVTTLGFAGAIVGYVGVRPTLQPTAEPKAPTALAPVNPIPSPPPAAPAPDQPGAVRYPMRALLGINTAVDVDGSRAQLLGLFPELSSEQVADEIRYTVPLNHRWFGEAELRWKNERAGKLSTVGFRPPTGDAKLQNQKQISDCLTQGLGKPEVRETDHLAGEVSYFWGSHFPKAWANLYTGYLWLSFEDPRGVAPVTFAQVVRTLDACAP